MCNVHRYQTENGRKEQSNPSQLAWEFLAFQCLVHTLPHQSKTPISERTFDSLNIDCVDVDITWNGSVVEHWTLNIVYTTTYNAIRPQYVSNALPYRRQLFAFDVCICICTCVPCSMTIRCFILFPFQVEHFPQISTISLTHAIWYSTIQNDPWWFLLPSTSLVLVFVQTYATPKMHPIEYETSKLFLNTLNSMCIRKCKMCSSLEPFPFILPIR